jgi:tetratricopeptide (TPR) repeat protein
MLVNRSEKCVRGSDEIETLMAVLDSHKDLFGPFHPQTLAVVNTLAIAFWRAGDIDRAIGLLDQTVDRLTSSLGREHPMRVNVLSTLGEIMVEQRHLEQASVILREVLECRVRSAGANHAKSLAAKGDLAAVLFELGQDEEADAIEREAFESARTYLGKTHPVSCVLAWNRALSYERCQDLDSAQEVIINELAWLLVEMPSCLETDQSTIRRMLAERLNWDAAKTC